MLKHISTWAQKQLLYLLITVSLFYSHFLLLSFSSRIIDIVNLDMKSAEPYEEKCTNTHEMTHWASSHGPLRLFMCGNSEPVIWVCLFAWLVFYALVKKIGYIADGSQECRLTILRTASHEAELPDHDFCLSRSHYSDTDPTSRERRLQRWSNPGPPHQESRALPSELPRPHFDSGNISLPKVTLLQLAIFVFFILWAITCEKCKK